MNQRAADDRQMTPWQMSYTRFVPGEQPLREALLVLGNGYFATRGAFEETSTGGAHYPGTYLAGGYNRAESEVAGRIIENEDLVNWPNWLELSFRIEGGSWFDLEQVEVLSFAHTLDLRHGVLRREVVFRDAEERETRLESRRIVHMSRFHVGAMEWVITALNWSGSVEVCSAIDGRVTNSGVARYSALEGKHLEVLEAGQEGEDAVYLVSRTKQSHIVMAQAVRTRIYDEAGGPAVVERSTEVEPERIGQHLNVGCEKMKPLKVEKVLALYTSRDNAISEPGLEARRAMRRLPGFEPLLGEHERAWGHLWRRADLPIDNGDPYGQLVLRLHIFHLLQVASMHTIDDDVGVPARGLHGEAYRGHIFWDELFIFPFLNLRMPEVSRALLMYRYRRLEEARHSASKAGLKGALFPWQSGSNGREESQRLHLNPKSGNWVPDDTHLQHHVNAAIAYNVWQHFQATGDKEFLAFFGAELLVEIARLFAGWSVYNADRQRYELRGVVGPDEFHTRYPGADEAGLDNNAYTNVMAVWVLKTALRALELISEPNRLELLDTLGVVDEELVHWEEVSRRMYLPFLSGEGQEGILSQFEGWEELEELDWEGMRERHGDVQRLDRLLEAEGDDVNRYKATKQADVLMLYYLFSAAELGELIARLGYDFDAATIPKTIEYYLARTSHGSTLSRVVHAWVLARSDRKRSWHLFENALASDVDDVQGGTTAEGIHLGAMAGTVDMMQRAYTGLEAREGVLWINPQLPEALKGLEFTVQYRGHWLAIDIEHDRLEVSFERGRSAPACIGFEGEIHTMKPGETKVFELRTGSG